MPPVPNGAILNYSGIWPAPSTFSSYVFGLSPDDAVAQVGQILTQGGVVIQGSNISNDTAAQVTGLSSIDVSLTLQVQNGVGFNDVSNVIDLITAAVQSVLGNPPVSQTIPQIQTPGATAATPTGQATSTNTGCQHTCGNPCWSFLDDPGAYVKCLTSSGLSTLGLVFIGLALGIVLLVTLQTKKEVGV